MPGGAAPPGRRETRGDRLKTSRALDERMMDRALALAERGRGRVEPNPLVGCVIARGRRVIGEGWHRRFGGPHAEVDALRRCKSGARGATAYVTLEPCCHHGRTPPCTDALIAAGVARVVAAVRDPDPRVRGRGFRALLRAGMRAERGLRAAPARRLNAPFFKRIAGGRPWVILKWAQSIDGAIATRTGDSKWISGERARHHAHRVRARVDAIIIGRTTALRDDPQLTARVGRAARIARRVVLDARLELPIVSRLVRTARQAPTWVFCGRGAAARRRLALERAGCRVVAFSAGAKDRAAQLGELLDVLGRDGCTNVLVEGGGELLGEFVDARLADEIHVYLAGLLIGGRDATRALSARGVARVRDALRPRELELRPLGDGWFLRGLLGA